MILIEAAGGQEMDPNEVKVRNSLDFKIFYF